MSPQAGSPKSPGRIDRQARAVAVDFALQGGGAHGAFALGVLDRALELPRIQIDGISGTSAGAMNAAVHLWIDAKKFHESFCQDLPADEALVMAVTQKARLAKTAGDASAGAAWKNKPSWCQISAEDRMIAPDNERRMAGRIGAKKVITLTAGHASLASNPSRSLPSSTRPPSSFAG